MRGSLQSRTRLMRHHLLRDFREMGYSREEAEGRKRRGRERGRRERMEREPERGEEKGGARGGI